MRIQLDPSLVVKPGDVFEPLEESAPVAWAEAPRRCRREPDGSAPCLAYHRVWQYLRLLGVITSVRTNAPFLVDVMGQLARSRDHGRVLISGTADYSLLAHVHHAYARHHAPLLPTVLDLCDSSLESNRWFGARVGLAVATVQANALQHTATEPFDLVCAHSFLGRFAPEARQQLVTRWASWLRPGGVAVTTLRVRPNAAGGRLRVSEDEARALAQRVVAAARGDSRAVNLDLAELEQMAYRYAFQKSGHKIQSDDEVATLFERAGFDLLLADRGGGEAERQRDRPASGAGSDTYRMRIVARRR